MTTKKEIRKEILALRKDLSQQEVRRCSEIICQKVQQTDAYRSAASLCVYMPIRNEVEADLLIDPAAKAGKRVYIPKVIGDEMVFNAYEENLMREGAYHIRESASEEILEPDETTLIIMPGSVFDLHCRRIGYGGGYYDKYLSRYPDCRTIAVCFDLQIIEELPAEEHDINPQMIISEKRIIEEP